MITKKKADISQTFTYISTAIVIVVVLGFGIMWLNKILTNVSEIECVKFKKDLELKVRNNIEYGRIDSRPLRVDCDFREICFVSDPFLFDDPNENPISNLDVHPIINDTYTGNVKQNVFFINHVVPEDFFYLERLRVYGDYLCFNVTRLGINMRLEGRGNYVLLSRET